MMRDKFAMIRRYFYEILESPPRGERGGAFFNRSIGILIILSLGATVCETVPSLHAEYGVLFEGVEMLALTAFSIEYCLRVWIAPEHIPYRDRGTLSARRAYILSPQGILDFLAITPLWIALGGFPDIRILIILRVLRVLLGKTKTQPKFDLHQSFRCSLRHNASMRRGGHSCRSIQSCLSAPSS
jgi:voltage-gated potassium channel